MRALVRATRLHRDLRALWDGSREQDAVNRGPDGRCGELIGEWPPQSRTWGECLTYRTRKESDGAT